MDLLSLLTGAVSGAGHAGQEIISNIRDAQPHTGYTPHQQAQMTPVGQPIPQDKMNSFSPQTRALAQIYQSNPQDPRVAHIDPKMFGYAPDNTVGGIRAEDGSMVNPNFYSHQSPKLQQHNDFLSGLMSLLQGNHNTNPQSPQSVNPGYIPLQNSGFGPAGSAIGLQPSYNPQGQGRNQ